VEKSIKKNLIKNKEIDLIDIFYVAYKFGNKTTKSSKLSWFELYFASILRKASLACCPPDFIQQLFFVIKIYATS
jgi:hypothetical protein